MNFDEIIEKRGAGTIRTELQKEMFACEGLLPMWVADMDFRSPSCITDALKDTLDNDILGYHVPPDAFYQSVIKWQGEKHGMHLSREDIKYVPGVVTGIAVAINAFTEENDKIVVQTPVYFPFFEYPRKNKRQVVYNSLIEKDAYYEMDYEDLERHFADGAKMLILCSPHNPAGRVWRRDELEKVAALADKYKVIVVADEIHSDMPLGGREVVSYATVSEAAANHSLTLTAPSKTFNIAGLASSIAIIQNEDLREKWVAVAEAYELNMGDFLGYVALTAAFEKGDKWRVALLDYLDANVQFTLDFFKQHIPQIKAWEPEASFLMWLDCRAMGMSDAQLMKFFTDKAGLLLSPGIKFGREARGFMRMNFAMPRPLLEKALMQLKEAF